MSTYTVGDLVVALGVSASTIRNWTEQPEFQPYLSNMATREGEFEHAKQREYTEEDLYVLNTIRSKKSRHNSWQDVAELLEDGERNRDLPESAALVTPETRAESFQLLSIARAKIEDLQSRVEDLENLLSEERDGRRQDVKDLTEEKAQLYKTLGRLEFILEQAGLDPKTGKQTSDDD